jgi:hypothetical protein
MNHSKVGVKNKLIDFNELRIRGYPILDLVPPLVVSIVAMHALNWSFWKSFGSAVLFFIAIHIVLEKDTPLIERVFDIDDGWVSKIFFLSCFYAAMEM